ncbi:MAG: hypothetical protein SGBAC_007490 [Bacillariaceae sp.]
MQHFLNNQKQKCLKGSIHPRLLMADLVEPEQVGGYSAGGRGGNKRKVKSLSPKRKSSKKLRSAGLVEPTQVGVAKRQVRSLSPKRKTTKKLRRAPQMTLDIDSDDSSLNSKTSTSSRKRLSSNSRTTKRRCASPTVESSFKLEAMQEEITRLQSIQDHMEKYQASLEKQHRHFQRELHAMELSHAMAESRTRELESELEEAVEENERFLYNQERSTKDDTKSNLELLQEENKKLRGILERLLLADLVEQEQKGGGTNKRQAKSLSPKRKTPKQLRNAPTTTVWIGDDDSSQNSKTSTSSRKRRSSKSRTTKHRFPSPIVESSFKLEAMQDEINKLKSIQYPMEKYQASLEKQHRDFLCKLHAMEVSHEKAESRNRVLEPKLKKVVEENKRLSCSLRARKSNQDESDSTMEHLRFENQILRGKLERCQLALLRSKKKRHSRKQSKCTDLEMYGRDI